MKRISPFFLSLALLISIFFTSCESLTDTYDPSMNLDSSASEISGALEIHFIDVGQADAALVICDQEAMLIDGGNAEDSSLIYSYLEQQDISALKYIVGSHAHEDHMGGLSGALNYATTQTAFCSVAEDDAKYFQSFVKYLSDQGVSITIPEVGSTYTLGDASFQFVGPIMQSNDPNNMSLVLRLEYGNTSFLFTGDTESSEEADILDAGYDLSATVLKVGHHGSSGSSSYAFLREISPQYAVISCGENNSYGHPHEETLSRLRDADTIIYRTDLQGTIICQSDGETVTFMTEKNADIQTNPTENAENITYIGNINSKTFHRDSCGGLPSEKNRVYFETRKDAIEQGYSPCGKCTP